jgi:hypothetical protein
VASALKAAFTLISFFTLKASSATFLET